MSRISFSFALCGVVLGASLACAQQPPARIRGQIEKIDGTTLTIKTRTGESVTLSLPESARLSAIVPASLADIKDNSYIGVAAMPQADGSQRALSVHIFPEAMRGTGEGHRPWDLRPNSTMTNALVASKVAGVDGQTLTLTYKDGEKKVTVPEGTPIVTYTAAERAEVKEGAQVIVMGPIKKPDGTLEADRINVGRGITPPM